MSVFLASGIQNVSPSMPQYRQQIVWKNVERIVWGWDYRVWEGLSHSIKVSQLMVFVRCLLCLGHAW